jgi:hypothetical protein
MTYKVICPVCEKEFYAAPSIFQSDFGMNEMGSGSCPGCSTYLNLTINDDKTQMTAMSFDEWTKSRKTDSSLEA